MATLSDGTALRGPVRPTTGSLIFIPSKDKVATVIMSRPDTWANKDLATALDAVSKQADNVLIRLFDNGVDVIVARK